MEIKDLEDCIVCSSPVYRIGYTYDFITVNSNGLMPYFCSRKCLHKYIEIKDNPLWNELMKSIKETYFYNKIVFYEDIADCDNIVLYEDIID